jgi:hypothetical protein
MQYVIEKMIKKVQETAKSQEFIEKHKKNAKDFTRARNLRFEEIVKFVIGNLGTTLDFEVLNFISGREQTVTASAISQARDKIKSSAFEEIFKESSRDIPVSHTYRGYRLTAYDGIKGELPRTGELMELGCISERNAFPQFQAVAEYDVLNCCYTNAIFKIGSADERSSAIELLKQHDYAGEEIFLLDRGFPSVAMIQQLEKIGKKYVMRVQKSFWKEVNDFGKSKSTDEIIEIHCDKRRGVTGHLKGVELPYSFQIRCVKIELNSDETEILVTNLGKSEFSRKDIGELYFLRWKIETGFLHLKYAVCIEDFMGVKENSIKQEFFASLFKANLFMQFVNVADDIIYNKKNRL